MKNKPQSANKPTHPSKIGSASHQLSSNKDISHVDRVNESFLSSEKSTSFLRRGQFSARVSDHAFNSKRCKESASHSKEANSRLSFLVSQGGHGGGNHLHNGSALSKREESAGKLLSNETSRIMHIPNEISLSASQKV